jgi:hypothetical protein
MVTVTSGANSGDLEGLAGQTVAQVRAAFASIYGIATDAVSTVNGNRVDGDYILNEGDELSFSRTVAQKG